MNGEEIPERDEREKRESESVEFESLDRKE
jgi:hypothetical protein